MAILKSKSGSSFNTSTGVKTSSSGQTTQVRSAKPTQQAGQTRSDFLKSLNKKGGSNYQATPDDVEMGNMDTMQNAKAGALPLPETPQVPPTTPPPTPTQGLVPYDQALKGIQTTVKDPTELTNTTNALKKLYQGGFQQTTASGVQAPPTQGAANTTIGQTVTPPEIAPSPLTNIVETDNTFDGIFSQFDDYFSPPKQKQSLLQEYKSMEKSLGINAMNEELLNSKRIIEGTEDDIRSEVQAVSGFATDSQVMALANARNKSLVKNYNYLLEARDSAMTQLNTMMNLSIEDRKMAENEFDRKMNFTFKVAEFKDKAVSNAREAYNNTIKLMGADGMYNALVQSGDPSAMSLAERTLGLPTGGLKIASDQAVKARAFETTKQDLTLAGMRSNLYTDKLQQQKLKQDLDIGTKPSTQLQQAQTEQSVSDISSLIKNPYIRTAVGPTWLGRFVGRGLDTATGERQNYIASVEKLRSQLSLDSLINAKAKGATFGALSDTEMRILSASASKLGTWANADESGKVSGYSASEKDFKKELNTINNFAKLDYILKGGSPTSVGVQVMPDGSFVTQNSDGTYTQLSQ